MATLRWSHTAAACLLALLCSTLKAAGEIPVEVCMAPTVFPGTLDSQAHNIQGGRFWVPDVPRLTEVQEIRHCWLACRERSDCHAVVYRGYSATDRQSLCTMKSRSLEDGGVLHGSHGEQTLSGCSSTNEVTFIGLSASSDSEGDTDEILSSIVENIKLTGRPLLADR